MRPILSLLVVLGLAGSLAACSSTGPTDDASSSPKSSAAADADACVTAGPVSDAVKVTGKAGKEPTVSFASPISVTKTQRTVVTKGDGPVVKTGQTATLDFTVYNGTSGKKLSTVGYTTTAPAPLAMDQTKYLVGLVKTVTCSTVGSRVVGVFPPADGWGDTGQPDIGVGAKDTTVVVVDIESVQASKATGVAQKPLKGFPPVTLAASGEPTVAIPTTDPPTKTEIEVLKKGDGAVVADGDSITGHYAGYIWRTKAVFQSTWSGDPVPLDTTTVVPGFKQALVGQKVGSQVMVIIPPAEGYGSAGQPDAGILGTDTILFVIDILAIN